MVITLVHLIILLFKFNLLCQNSAIEQNAWAVSNRIKNQNVTKMATWSIITVKKIYIINSI